MTYNYQENLAPKTFDYNLARTLHGYAFGETFAHMDEFSMMGFNNPLVKGDAMLNKVTALDTYQTKCGINDFLEVMKKNPEAMFENKYRKWSGEKGIIGLATTMMFEKGNVALYDNNDHGGFGGFLIDGSESCKTKLQFMGQMGITLCSRYFDDGILSFETQTLSKHSPLYKAQELQKYEKLIEYNLDGISIIISGHKIDLTNLDPNKLDKNARKAHQVLMQQYADNDDFKFVPHINEVVLAPEYESFCGRLFSISFAPHNDMMYGKSNRRSLAYAKSYIENYSVKAHVYENDGIEIPIMTYNQTEHNSSKRFVLQKPDIDMFKKAEDLLLQNNTEKKLGRFCEEIEDSLNLAKKGFKMHEEHVAKAPAMQIVKGISLEKLFQKFRII